MPVRPRGGGGEESAVAAVAAASSNSTSAAVATRSTSTSTTTTANTRTSPGGGGDPHHSPEPPFASHRPTANIPTDESSSLSSPNHHHKSSSSSSLPLGSDNNNNTQTADNNNNDTKKSTACLHCQQPFPPFTTKQDFRRLQEEHVQVRCEGCTNYICSDCHWCHEYQANHEIRVCDRCEGFYCKLCDEMDQCDDCGEVVCQHCTTLLSCKFCGGGLCEECATACGRCGIVLCSRDAKFAVECDTCRLSYCLVCLASGSKDRCVRCGHRPSKRMEQLVHLRLKSIYKAFKQAAPTASSRKLAQQQNAQSNQLPASAEPLNLSSNSTAAAAAMTSLLEENPDLLREPQALFEAAVHSMGAAASSATSAAPSCMANASASSNHHHHHLPSPSLKTAHISQEEWERAAKEKIEQYKAEKARADAAAAALLEELDEEEKAAETKKSKKKKKKEKLQAKKEENRQDDTIPSSLHEEVSKFDNANASSNVLNEEGSFSDKQNPHEESFFTTQLVVPEKTTKNEQSIENEAADLEENKDIDGLEALLNSLKGVPGKASSRKTIKKALKRLRNEVEIDDVELQYAEPDNFVPQEPEPDAGESVPFEVDKRVADLLQVAAETHTKSAPNRGPSGACECILHMAPSIVGWVIGKGGQRIRDLMDESGARIWIDQETVGKDEPRTVFVSGSRKNVDNAVVLIHDLILKAPTDSPYTPYNQESAKETPSKSGTSKEHAAAKHVRSNQSKSQVSPAPPRDNVVITCEPRFVPLLIGKRGWTIKNIQETSGARVDIDQSVSPRKITVSGKKEAVDVAVRLVENVLSYPNAESIHGDDRDTGEDNLAVQPLTPREDEHGGSSLTVPVSTVSFADKLRGGNSPMGGAKRAISPSSSLSSTPEPSANGPPMTRHTFSLPPQANHAHLTSGMLPPQSLQHPHSVLPGLQEDTPNRMGLGGHLIQHDDLIFRGNTALSAPQSASKGIFQQVTSQPHPHQQQSSSSFLSSLKSPPMGGFPEAPMNQAGAFLSNAFPIQHSSGAAQLERPQERFPPASAFNGDSLNLGVGGHNLAPRMVGSSNTDLFSAQVNFLEGDRNRTPQQGVFEQSPRRQTLGSLSYSDPSPPSNDGSHFLKDVFANNNVGSNLLGGIRGLSVNEPSIQAVGGLWGNGNPTSPRPSDKQPTLQRGNNSLFSSPFSPQESERKSSSAFGDAWGMNHGM